jgi:hypothetical protein
MLTSGPITSSTIPTEPVWVSVLCPGPNVTAILQLLPGASGSWQPLVTVYAAAPVPDNVGVSIVTETPVFFLPSFLILMFLLLLPPSLTLPKFIDLGDIESFSFTSIGVGVGLGVAVTVGVPVAVTVGVGVVVGVPGVPVRVGVALTVVVAVAVAVAVGVTVGV